MKQLVCALCGNVMRYADGDIINLEFSTSPFILGIKKLHLEHEHLITNVPSQIWMVKSKKIFVEVSNYAIS